MSVGRRDRRGRLPLAVALAAVAAVVFVSAAAAPAPAAPPAGRRMALTFDDLPAQRAESASPARLAEITQGIVGTLARRRLPAVGFVNEGKLAVGGKVDPARVALLERWLDAGIELGNHSYSHLDLHRVAPDAFLADVARGEEVTRPLAAARGIPYRYFRHPYLHTGRELAVRRAVHAFLAERGYRVAPVTIDNSEWIFAAAYDQAIDRKDRRLRKRLATAYLDYMEAMCAYYEGQSRALFGREIPQVLLVHANTLNAHHLPALLKRFERRGYRFVALESALADPAYATPDEYTGPAGTTWIHRWAMTRGIDRATFRGEPTTPAWVQEAAGVRE